jgi:hypothetical protein
MRFPTREATTVVRDRELRLPSPWAFVGYSVILGITAAPVVIVHTEFAIQIGAELSIDLATLRLAGAALTVALVGALGAPAWVDAARRLGAYRLE